MKQKLILLQILSISFLICSFTQAQRPNVSLNPPASENLTQKSFSIKFQKTMSNGYDSKERHFTVPLQLGLEQATLPFGLSAKTGTIWMNNDFYSELKGAPYECSKSKTCLGEETLPFAWQYNRWRNSAKLVREQVSFGGLTHYNFSTFIINETPEQPHNLQEQYPYVGVLGLGVKRANQKIPTIYEYLKAEGLIDEQILSINLKNNDEGELIFGRYPSNKTKADFKFLEMTKEYYDGFNVQIRSMYQMPLNSMYDKGDVAYGHRVTFDFNSPVITVPAWAFNKILDYIRYFRLGLQDGGATIGMLYSNGQYPVRCSAKDKMKDLFIELEGLTLSIPASAYIVSAKGWTFQNDFYKVEGFPSDEKCALALAPEGSNLIIGQPFFKCYDVVIDPESESIGFSPRYIPEPVSFLANSRIRTPLLGLVGIFGLVLFGFGLYFVSKKFRKHDAELNEEASKFDEAPSSQEEEVVVGPVQSLPYPVEVGIPVQNLPYPYGFQQQHNYVNLQSDERIGYN